MIERYTRWLLRWRWAVLLASVAALLALAAGGRALQFTNDYRVFFSKENPQLTAFENLQDTYTKNDNVLFLLLPQGGDVFTPRVLQAVAELTEAAWQIPHSVRVDSLSNFQHSRAEGDELTVSDLVEDPPGLDDAAVARIRAVALHEPLLVQRLVAPDGHATGINVTIELPGQRPTAEVPEVVARVREIATDFRARHPDIALSVSGVVMMNNAFPEASKADMRTLVPLAFAAIVAGLLFFLRSPAGTLATVLVILFSIAMAMGSAGWLGIRLTPPSASAPILILTLAVADSVHFLSTLRFLMGRGHGRAEAIVESMRLNFHPIFLTSLTTVVGFLSMNFSDAPPFRDLGNITALGVGYAWLLTVTFLPALLAVLPLRARPARSHSSRLMAALAEFVIRRRRPLFWGGTLLIAGLLALIPRNEINDVFVEYFDRSVQFRRDADRVAEHLAGLYFIDYSLDSGQPGGVADPAFLRRVEAFADWYRQQPEVRHVNVITDVFKRLNRNLHGDDPAWYRLPAQRDLAAQYLLLYEMSLPYGLDLNNQIDVDKRATRMTVTLKTLSTRQTLYLERRAEDWLRHHAPGLFTHGASPTLMFSHIGMRNIHSMLTGTAVALVLISLLLVVALRSPRMGLISLVPNLVPAGMAFGVWALLVGRVGLALSVVAAMTLGIVVDDTIHFLSKYLRARREQGLSTEDAIRHAFASVGVALWITTVVLVAGFLVLALSHFELNADMGLLTAITLAIALLVDFFYLPTLLLMLDRAPAPATAPVPAQP